VSGLSLLLAPVGQDVALANPLTSKLVSPVVGFPLISAKAPGLVLFFRTIRKFPLGVPEIFSGLIPNIPSELPLGSASVGAK